MLCGSAFFVSKWRLCSTVVCAIIILKKMKSKRIDIRIVLSKIGYKIGIVYEEEKFE